jgi:UDP:flavonoid glycosyltransferase YjiC (YdhE family)
MHIALVSLGTRGDAQPFVALGVALQRLGHRATIVTHEDHRSLVEAHGLAIRPVCGSFRKLLESAAGLRWLASSDRPLEYVRAFDALFAPLVRPWAEEIDAALADTDAAGVAWMLPFAMQAAERRRLPMAILSPFPVVPTGDYVPLPRIPGVTPWAYRALTRWLYRKLWTTYRPDSMRYRTQHQLPALRGDAWSEVLARGVAHLHMYSHEVLPRPTDWPACAEVTGYCFLEAPPTWRPPSALSEFLAAGAPPVYVGFGSMTGMDPEVLASQTREALKLAGQRAVVGMGWGGLAAFGRDADNVMIIDDVPHDWLFPQVAAVVHHGGAGTLAAAVRAGRPSVIVPFFGDQPLWARSAADLGVATAPVLKRQLTAARLGDAIRRAASDPELARRAEEIGARVRAEDGATRTAERLLRHLQA